jgi:PST family polysaccharide transporter
VDSLSPPVQSLTDRTARAVQWRFASTIVGGVSQFSIGVLLARLLTPGDFGLVALAMVVIGLVRTVGDFGMGSAIVQRATLTDRHIRAGFTFSIALGLAIAALLAAVAPLGAVVLKEPRVMPVLRALSLGFAIGSTAGVAWALMRRRLDFKRLFFIDTISHVAGYGGVSVTLALLGFGVWSLVWGSLLQTLLTACAQLAVVRHPIRPLIARRELNDLLRFGLGATASGCVNYLALNGDNFVVGRSMGAAGLGLYARAYTLMTLPFTHAASAMSGALFPAFAQVQREPERLRRGYLLATELSALVAAPAMGTMIVAAPYLIVTLYGPRWAGVVAPLQILCVAGYFRCLYHLGGVVAQSVGWVYKDLWRQVGYATLVILGALAGLRFGLQGVAAGVGVAIVYMYLASAQLALRATQTRWPEYVRVQIAPIVIAAVTCSVALAVRLGCESGHASSAVTSVAILAAAAVPWSAGALWMLGAPRFSTLRSRLPGWCLRPIEAMARNRGRDVGADVERAL